jgi:hypothetical protein
MTARDIYKHTAREIFGAAPRGAEQAATRIAQAVEVRAAIEPDQRWPGIYFPDVFIVGQGVVGYSQIEA